MRKTRTMLLFFGIAIVLFSTSHGEVGPEFVKQRIELPNGLVVISVEKHKLPMVHIEMLVKTGSVYDSDEKAGLANLVSNLIDKGTDSRTAIEIAEEIDFMGARTSVTSGSWTTRGSITVLKQDVKKGMDLISDIVINPAFSEEEIERERKKVLSGILRKKENPNLVASETFREMVYEGHPLRRPSDGYAESVKKIDRSDIQGFYQGYFLPNNSILVIVGDMRLSQMEDLAREYFGKWEKGKVHLTKIPDVSPLKGKRVKLVNMDINQSYLQCGHIGLRRNDPDYSACRAMNYILGGGAFASRFFKEIRKEAGLAYSVYSYFSSGSLQPGTYTAGLQTKVESTSDALGRMLELIQKIRVDLVSKEELDGAKTFYEGSLARQGETYSQVSGLVLNGEYFGLPDQYWVKEIEEIVGLSRERIREVAKKYLDPENLVIAIATKKSDLDLNVQGINAEMIEE